MNASASSPPQAVVVDSDAELAAMRRLAHMLDSSIPIPGTNRRIGLDGLIGLIPGIGDGIGTLISVGLIYWGAKRGAPVSTVLRMFGNVLLESILGAVPLFGDLFDFAWKANERNVELIERAISDPFRRPRSQREIGTLLLGIAVAGILLVVLCIAGALALLLPPIGRLLS